MRLVIDMQGAQSSGSRNRGIGRYTTSLVKAICQNRGEDEVVLALNGLFADTIDVIRAEFSELLPLENIRVWTAPAPCHAADSAHASRRCAAEKIREAFLASLAPDAVLITSLFEGLGDNAVTSIGEFTTTLPTAVVLYDLIPLIHRHIYLSNPVVDRWYQNKIGQMRRADLLLSISESSGAEGREYLCFPEERVVNISTACDEHFRPMPVSAARIAELQKCYGIARPIVMYTGGIDHRKNIEGLIRAYAALPLSIRENHQLAVVCSIHEPERQRLKQLATDAGLLAGELVMTGFVPEADLLALYNICKLFVFPSWHEGFGLPALEAMACGRPVIGANTSSVPEVIGRDDALFDPRSDEAITSKMLEVLTDDQFRDELAVYGKRQASRFSWSDSAVRAWQALRSLHRHTVTSLPSAIGRPRLAYLSPVPSARSGIADYSAELLPELARHYSIDVVVSQEEALTDPWILANCNVRDPEWFRDHADRYERVLYHFGNSHFHGHMFDLIREIPGVVVLHDFFLSGIVRYMDVTGRAPGEWSRELENSHGWESVASRYSRKDEDVAWAYPCNLAVLQSALGVIVHSESSKRMADAWFGVGSSKNWIRIPLLRMPANNIDRTSCRNGLGIKDEDFLVCCFGLLGPTKLNHRLLQAWLASPMAKNSRCRLVFVGQNEGGEYGAELVREIRRTASRVEITGWVDTNTYRQWLGAADLAVQLRTLSRGETSAAVLDCMNYGVATIVNANGAMADLPDSAVCKLPEEFSDQELSEALTNLWRDHATRTCVGERARELILREHDPRRCGDVYANAIEQFYSSSQRSIHGLVDSVRSSLTGLSKQDCLALAGSLSKNFPPSPRRPNLLIDVSSLAEKDFETDIQKAVRALLLELLNNPPAGWQVEPVYANSGGGGYRYARRYTCGLLQISAGWATDDPVEVYQGDIFLILDFQPQVVSVQKPVFDEWRLQGCKVYAVVHDLSPLLDPKIIAPEAVSTYQNWLVSIAQFDGALTISRAVADELILWLNAFGSEKRKLPFDIHYFHLGAGIGLSAPCTVGGGGADEILTLLAKRPTFLMVGAVDGRMGHGQVLASFEHLWASGLEINLVIVGNQELVDDQLIGFLRSHEKLNDSLFWIENISEEYLEKICAESICLIAASEGNGFGASLVEAARGNLPIIARDIPAFREVAGDHAYYFDNDNSQQVLAEAIENWLALFRAGDYPRFDSMPWQTMKESACQVVQALLGGVPYKSWLPDGTLRYWGNDPRLHTEVGVRQGRAIISNSKSGFLIYGPYAPLAAGRYRLQVEGHSQGGAENCWLDVSCESASLQLLNIDLPRPDCQGKWLATAELLLEHRVSDLEFRIWVSAEADLSVDSISISPLEASKVGIQEGLTEECSEVVEVA